jgi:hypothetical protein
MLDSGLKVYESLAMKLKWSNYFKLLKTYLFKLLKIHNSKGSINNGNELDIQYEKNVIKVVCKMLSGFNFSGVPDAVELIIKKQSEYTTFINAEGR